MPVDALPQPWPARPAGLVNYRREYRDALGRPMTGHVTLIGQTGLATAPVVATLAVGVLDVDLQPGSYRVQASLRTVDGGQATDSTTITLEG